MRRRDGRLLEQLARDASLASHPLLFSFKFASVWLSSTSTQLNSSGLVWFGWDVDLDLDRRLFRADSSRPSSHSSATKLSVWRQPSEPISIQPFAPLIHSICSPFIASLARSSAVSLILSLFSTATEAPLFFSLALFSNWTWKQLARQKSHLNCEPSMSLGSNEPKASERENKRSDQWYRGGLLKHLSPSQFDSHLKAESHSLKVTTNHSLFQLFQSNKQLPQLETGQPFSWTGSGL